MLILQVLYSLAKIVKLDNFTRIKKSKIRQMEVILVSWLNHCEQNKQRKILFVTHYDVKIKIKHVLSTFIFEVA